jgi:hypothetical protein
LMAMLNCFGLRELHFCLFVTFMEEVRFSLGNEGFAGI